MTGPPIFDLCGPLPQGTTVLEASAGTGKTFTIAGLAVRYLAEGVARIDELMLVTFGRAATAELRERVRERLVETTTSLDDLDAARQSTDDLVRHLAQGTDAEVDVRRRRLATAAANFDAATIATTHGFCHQMLAGMGIAADVDHDVTFAEWTGDLVSDVATDLYVADYGAPVSPGEEPTTPLDFRTASAVAGKAVGDPAARLEPADADRATYPEAAVRYRFAARARDTVAQRKRAMRVMDYDDLLVHLRDALTDPETGEDACARVRSRYNIVLVDEFQDTDPVQWEILERAFHGHRTLVLIGDPKQAIYAFRGADVATYLLATEAAAAKATLGTNWRSDRPLVDALLHVLGDVALGDPRILVRAVTAGHPEPTLTGAPVDAPLRIRAVPRKALGVEEPEKPLTVGDVRAFVARDVAADIVDVLCSDAQITVGVDKRPVEPADIAVLVQRNEDGVTVRDALSGLGVPVVLLGTISVFSSRAARDWRTLLTALEQPHRPGLARAAALTDFVGWTATDLATADDATLDALGARLREWAAVLTGRGVAALLERITATYGLTGRVLAREDGERDLTDLRHIGQALHAQATQSRGGVASLVEWLQHRINEARDDPDEERSRRLESDAKAVQVLTVHRSKGLQFPIVYAPFLWSRWVPTDPDPLRLHDDTGARVLDVGSRGGPAYDEHKAAHLAEDAGESLRLAYVALTRAKCQVVTHWAPTTTTACAPWHRLLFGVRTTGGVVPDKVAVPTDHAAREQLTAIASTSDGGVSVEAAHRGTSEALSSRAAPPPELGVRAFDRVLDLTWARTSYSRLTAALHEQARGQVTSEPDTPGVVDEVPVAPESTGEPTATTDWPASPMGDLPSGAAFGTLVHRVLERVDFAAAGLRAEMVRECSAAGAERFVGVPSEVLADALVPALQTSLGPLAGGRRLADIAVDDRLDELDFELPLAGGDVPTGEAAVGQIATLLRRHLPADAPLADYADDLAVPVLASQKMRGFLTGSIDAVLRVRDDDGVPRYLVVDYKTNWLGGEPLLTAGHYRAPALARAMRRAHYPLQALLYSVALHRFLRWRQPGYRPDVHLGGVLYLFLRGMCGADTPVVDGVPCGVFSWAPPAGLVEDLSDLLDGGGP
ncbi:MAG: UvrD-helicase domain-containing protein [Actinomycetota bacterium]|nr:UvrD-helicase domain-containing protein [Actinomycetota bacterium]